MVDIGGYRCFDDRFGVAKSMVVLRLALRSEVIRRLVEIGTMVL